MIGAALARSNGAGRSRRLELRGVKAAFHKAKILACAGIPAGDMGDLMEKARRVVFFDSGVGGLSVYRDVKKLNPGLEGYYIFDNECFPYGTKTAEFLEERVCSILLKMRRLYSPAAVVIACNTASTVVLPQVRAALDIPVVGVVPAIKPAAQLSQKKVIALLATPGTVSRPYTDELIRRYAGGCRVLKVGSPSLAMIAEKRLSTGLTDVEGIKKAVQPIMDLKGAKRPDVVVLGCTHYPFIADVLERLMPDIRFIDTGEAIGRRVADVLEKLGDGAWTERTSDRAFYTGILDDLAGRTRMVRSFGFKSLEQFKTKQNQ
jgi:glutamate racemase